jgi:uncharacterized protein YbjT (DUF2867 family)
MLQLPERLASKVEIYEADISSVTSIETLPKDIDAAYYLVHSMTAGKKNFDTIDDLCARNFVAYLDRTNAKQAIYLGAHRSQEKLSRHLASRCHVEDVLNTSKVPLTALHSAVIIGAGSASFEIIRDLVEKLPVMVAPKWIASRCQPISIFDVVFYLNGVLGCEAAYGRGFDIGGPDTLTYKQMMDEFARVRGLKRFILNVPVLTPNLSSLWLVFITGVNFSLARVLIESLKCDAVSHENEIGKLLPHECLNFEQSVRRAFRKIAEHAVVSSWKDAWLSGDFEQSMAEYVGVPKHGCLTNIQVAKLTISREEALDRLWKIGGKTGWYVMDWAWRLRGRIDKIIGGVGLRRGRRDPQNLRDGDALDFWRVILADREHGRLILYAEMKLPGEAWLAFELDDKKLVQTAVFRPKGVFGRLYWYAVQPFHGMIFGRMARKIVSK